MECFPISLLIASSNHKDDDDDKNHKNDHRFINPKESESIVTSNPCLN